MLDLLNKKISSNYLNKLKLFHKKQLAKNKKFLWK